MKKPTVTTFKRLCPQLQALVASHIVNFKDLKELAEKLMEVDPCISLTTNNRFRILNATGTFQLAKRLNGSLDHRQFNTDLTIN